ncbi:MAG: porin family protein [Chlorobium sp.]|nr:MAG: porin family protein [Chlorobium sp.]
MRTIIGEKMKKTLLLAMLFAGLGSAPAFAAPYCSSSVGLGMAGDFKEPALGNVYGVDSGFAINGAVGYDFSGLRAEAAVGYQENDFTNEDNLHTSLLTVMANGYYDLKTSVGIKPYVMAGLGIATIKADDSPGVAWLDDTYFAWQLGAGVGYKVSGNVTIDVGYRYVKPEGLECPNHLTDVTWESHNILAGIRYKF